MSILQQKKAVNDKWRKKPKVKTAEQRKNEELHGKSVINHGTGKKLDGSLMGAQADWRNTQQSHTNSRASS